MTCTWKDCAAAATHPQIDRNGAGWANLCPAHHAELDAALSADVKVMMRAWVLAKGGAEMAAEESARDVTSRLRRKPN